ncbi:hypothetical protein [Hymenobacter gummosus]|nr:hypothetical protein [Hymenobacter gummosus]
MTKRRAPREKPEGGDFRSQLIAQLVNALVRVGLDHLLKHFGL